MKNATWPLLGLAFACGGAPNPAQIRSLVAAGQIAEVVRRYPELRRDGERVAALEALATRGDDPQAAGILLEAARRSTSPRVRAAAIEGLGSVSDLEAEAELLEALGDPQPVLRAAARDGVRRRGAAMVPRLRRAALSHPNPLVRAASVQLIVAEAAGGPGAGGAAELALDSVDDPAPAVRLEAVRGLGLLRHGPARPALMARLRTDPDREVRLAAESALAVVGREEDAPRATVAVLPLRVDGKDEAGRLERLAARLSDVTRARLSASGVATVVDRGRIEDVLKELRRRGELVYDGDAPNAPAIGRFRIANQLVYGSVLKEGPVYTLVLKRLEVSTLELVPGAAVSLSGYGNELDRLVDEVVDRFVRGFR